MPAPHILVITGEPDGREYAIECPGITDACRAWTDCATCPADYDAVDDGDPVAHGVPHQWLDSEWMVPITPAACFVATNDHLPGAAEELQLGPGRYPVTFHFEEFTYLVLALAEPAEVCRG